MKRSFLWPLVLCGALLPGAAHADEPKAPDLRLDALRDFRKSHAFQMIDNPRRVSAAEATYLQDDDYVLGVTLNGESRAYPLRYIAWHHGINDRIGDLPYAVTYCSVCNTGIAYDLRLDGKEVALDFHGLYNGVVALQERETGTVFLQADGRFVRGKLTGKRLQNLPLTDTTWAQWRKLHPETTVMAADPRFTQFYRPASRSGRPRRESLAPLFIATMTRGDLRMGPFERVYGLALTTGPIQDATPVRAYPMQAVMDAGGVVNDTAGDLSLAVFVEPESQTPVAVNRSLEGRVLTFEARKEGATWAVFDRETGTRWTVEGRGESGPLAGKKLQRLPGNISLWYGWSAYYPETSIFGRSDPPKPGNPFAAPS